MEQVQIIGGGDLATVFRLLTVEATELIRVEDGIHDFQVWELPKTEYERFSETVHTLEWDDNKYVWWRDSGSNIELNEVMEVEVNGRNMKVHNQDCEEEPYIRSYEDIFELCCEYYGVSKETNVACVVEDLATLNGMTKAEFIKMYAVTQEGMLMEMEEWARQRLNEKFKVHEFAVISKQDDIHFQVLVFLAEAIEKLSLASTIAKHAAGEGNDIGCINKIAELQKGVHELQEQIRIHKKTMTL